MIREMNLRDCERIAQLEIELFSCPWSKGDFEREMTENQFAHYFVVEEDNKIVGYCGVWTLYEQAQITTIGVTQEYQCRGIASIMMNKIEEVAIECGCETCSLEVRVSNIAAQKLYEKFGYFVINTRKSYYSDNHEDAFLMMKAIGGNL